MKKFLPLFLLLNISYAFAQNVSININSLPKYHSKNDTLYLAGSINNWNPCDPKYRFQLNSNGTYSLDISSKSTFEFKITRGSWQTAEKDSSCDDISNRTIDASKTKQFSVQIANWADHCSPKTKLHTAATNVSILTDSFFIPQLNRYRRIWIYLPPNYNETIQKYPVIYMHDGQNLFDAYTSYAGEWAVDETLNRLFETTKFAAIVVGIDNGGSSRMNEYSPWIHSKYGGGEGDKYLQFIVNTLKPEIDKKYRTKADRENTGIMGSSMGGLISFYAAMKYANVFSKFGVFSPSFWFSKEAYKNAAIQHTENPVRIYILAGKLEAPFFIQSCERMIKTLKKSGYSSNEILLKTNEKGKHNEAFWKSELSDAIKWMFQ